MDFRVDTQETLHPTGRAALSTAHDPDASTPLQVEVTRIRVYERNPRRGENPEYGRIKASIRARGMDQPLAITCRPGERDYVVHAGGNTRLRILKELYEETGEARFSRIHCLLRPWTRESDVLLAHLVENDLRGHLTLIDRARAVHEAKALLGEELGIRVSQRRLEAELRNAGYSISHSRISQMEYAVITLLPLIPHALEAGLGWRQVGRIRSLERCAGALWQRYCPESEGEFDMLFASLCRRYDGPDWDTDALQGALEVEIAQEAEFSIHAVRMALDGEIEGRAVEFPEPDPDPEPVPQRPPDARCSPGPGAAEPGAGTPGPQDGEGAAAGHDAGRTHGCNAPPRPAAHRDLPYELASQALAATPGGPDLDTLRNQAWTFAQGLARRHGIGELVAPLAGRGLGYILCDVPDLEAVESLHGDCADRVSLLWWQLAACSEMTVAPPAALACELPLDSVLRTALEDHDPAWLLERVPVPDPGHTGYRLWSSLHEQDWNDLVRLMDTYRRIRHAAFEAGENIWEELS